MTRRKRRSFTVEQKAAAVERVRPSGRSIYQVARELARSHGDRSAALGSPGRDRRSERASGRAHQRGAQGAPAPAAREP